MTQSSFVLGWRLDGTGGGAPLDSVTSDSGGETWVHLDYSVPTIDQELSGLGLHPWVIESLTRIDTRPRTVTLDDGILVVVRGVNMNPGADPEDMVSLRLWIEPHRLITVRQRRLFAVQDVSSEIAEGHGPRSVAGLVVVIIEHLADRISHFVDSIEERIVSFEDLVETEAPRDIRAKVSAVRRQTAAVRRFLSPQRDALDALYRDARTLLKEELSYVLREQADRIARYVEDLDLVRERALVIQEELLNRLAQEQNARMYVLSIIAAIFLPITFITGLFGMNVAGLPGLENPSAFLFVAGTMAAITAATIVLFRFKRWL